MTRLGQRLGIPRYKADERYQAGLAAFTARDLKMAIAELQAAIELLPNHAEYHATLGFLLLEDKQRAKADVSFERSITLNPYEMLSNYGKGMIAYRAKDWKAAAGYFASALVARPNRPETQYYMAMVKHRLGKNGDALNWMRSAAAGFATAKDRRESHCSAWMREFEKLYAAR